jgi:hypothetical protein
MPDCFAQALLVVVGRLPQLPHIHKHIDHILPGQLAANQLCHDLAITASRSLKTMLRSPSCDIWGTEASCSSRSTMPRRLAISWPEVACGCSQPFSAQLDKLIEFTD